ncbi:NAD(P)/FAD-dependent oxidoreductase [Nodularia sphaerocarpa]|uniref:NAD(P)/FAD-dependent oxidoreductase n=1 Tax=Nodularia sphaerocarpa TaxID=137816 RepID=UPI001EFC159B|nr:NAD(P)/FAD-dependent oxidoreductase [Nodularia sphaerocarpa]MDB9375872.1 NAD(P)/FAD-dependent oxidoreductase [Nodularia sphaerocarpa CS-585]MDB9379562.1 NAD(P)/FAD-dependent oxidoreductase [Nodularia sphaerocarpa CS-585A2]ULP71811.1 NADH dehydrogenase [Nodularia sphaerocarpa UHCC 0038]
MRTPRIVIVGAGFGGLQTAQSLANSGADVCLIDRNNYHTFVPLLYQVATSQLEPEYIAYPIRRILRRFSGKRQKHKPKTRFLWAEMQRIDFSAQVVETDRCAIAYDFLVLATGSKTQYLGVTGASEYAFPMRTLEEAIKLRNQILTCLELANQESDRVIRQQLLTFTIVGGGATGVEIAGALMEMLRGKFRRDYPRLDLQQVRLILVQSGDRLLSELPKKLGVYTYNRLSQLGVEIYLQTRVSQVTPESVHLQNNEVIPTATVIWTAGLEANFPQTSAEISTAKKEKILVHPTLQLLEQPNVYAIGDLAYIEQNKPLAGVAPEALQQGVTVARNIQQQLRGKPAKPFSYFNKGRLAIIGCYSGVGKIGNFAFTGFLAWVMWLGVHLVYLPGYRSRLLVLLSWLYTYLLGDRAVRLILPI